MKTIALPLLALFAVAAQADSPFATSVVSATGFTAGASYSDPTALLGSPSTRFGGPGTTYLERTKLVEGQYGTDAAGDPLITRIGATQSVTVTFDHDIVDDPANPYGIDFIVFGNSFFVGNGFADDSTNLNTFGLTGDVFGVGEQVSVSPDDINWYTYTNPLANTLFPTNAYQWDRTSASWTDNLLDFTKPVNPSLTAASFAGKSAADAIDMYGGSAGGAGFDLAPSGFSSIRYIRVTGIAGSPAGVIDGFADVAPIHPTPEPATFAALGLGALAFVRRRRR